jgi:hypothetical protein
MEDKRFYGIYEGICTDINDPEKTSRIRLQVPQVLGTEVTEWAKPCLPVSINSNHPDHLAHTAAQVAALLNNHTASTDSQLTGASTHSHSVSISTHSGNSGTLTHAHKTTADAVNKLNAAYGTVFNDATNTLEHTPHRLVPNIGQKVWIMFIAGDPNFPVWMGVEL